MYIRREHSEASFLKTSRSFIYIELLAVYLSSTISLDLSNKVMIEILISNYCILLFLPGNYKSKVPAEENG